MGAIGPGDFVECVDLSPNASGRAPRILVLGGVYRVDSVGMSTHPKQPNEPAVFFWPPRTKQPNGLLHNGFAVWRFRPIYRPKQDLIESLKAPPIQAPPVRENALIRSGFFSVAAQVHQPIREAI